MRSLALLGPQRRQPTVADACRWLGVDGPVVAITAGWQEREGEIEELAEHLDRPVTDLRLHERAEDVFDKHPKLFEAYRRRQDRLAEMQRLYRYRLDFTIEPARELLRREGDAELLDPEREAAIEALRRLDAEHLKRIVRVHRNFDRRYRPRRRSAVQRHRQEIAEALETAAGVAIAGGHVAVLLNRLRLFGIGDLLRRKPIVAWSAGAMVLGERIVLFHDSPPWGAGSAEIFDAGLDLYHRLLPLPDASQRLRLQDPARVALLARRFAPAKCVALDDGAAVVREKAGWRSLAAARRLVTSGTLQTMEAA